MDPLVRKARDFATRMHRRIDHRRKYTQQPYDTHLAAVARLVAGVTDDPETLAAAWLHDVVEDTEVTLEQVRAEFGDGVAALVSDLTDVSRPSDGNRAARKAVDRKHSARASPRAKTVKLADLLDNCRDIRRGDPRFARVFLAEAAALLPVLDAGDARLHERLAKEIETGVRALGLAWPEPLAPAAQTLRREQDYAQRRAVRIFVDSVTAIDLAEPLAWFGAGDDAAAVAAHADTLGAAVVGLMEGGKPWGFAVRSVLRDGRCRDVAERFAAEHIVTRDAPLRDVVHALTRRDNCFVTLLGQVGGVVRREHLNSPVARMWLFGLITMLEMSVVEDIRACWPGDGWRAQLPLKRLEKAEALSAERRRQGQRADLLECLQFADKARLLLSDPERRQALGYKSAGAADQAVRDVESLRNNLAHGQDVVAADWVTIARLVESLDDLLGYFARSGKGDPE